jgi:hypothetical protein
MSKIWFDAQTLTKKRDRLLSSEDMTLKVSPLLPTIGKTFSKHPEQPRNVFVAMVEEKKKIVPVGIGIEARCLMAAIPRTNCRASTFQRLKPTLLPRCLGTAPLRSPKRISLRAIVPWHLFKEWMSQCTGWGISWFVATL